MEEGPLSYLYSPPAFPPVPGGGMEEGLPELPILLLLFPPVPGGGMEEGLPELPLLLYLSSCSWRGNVGRGP